MYGTYCRRSLPSRSQCSSCRRGTRGPAVAVAAAALYCWTWAAMTCTEAPSRSGASPTSSSRAPECSPPVRSQENEQCTGTVFYKYTYTTRKLMYCTQSSMLLTSTIRSTSAHDKRMSWRQHIYERCSSQVISYGNWRPVVQRRLADSDADAQAGQQHRPVAALSRVRYAVRGGRDERRADDRSTAQVSAARRVDYELRLKRQHLNTQIHISVRTQLHCTRVSETLTNSLEEVGVSVDSYPGARCRAANDFRSFWGVLLWLYCRQCSSCTLR